MNRALRVFEIVGEQTVDFTRSLFSPFRSLGGIRSAARAISSRFWPLTHPAAEGTMLNYDLCRALYRNENDEYALGSGFCKPIVNLQVSFVGLPTATTENELLDDYLKDCVNKYWADEIQQMVRAAIRDSKVIVRIVKPDIFDPLMTIDESEHCRLETIAPERVDIERNFRNKNIIERVIVKHRMVMVINDGDPTIGIEPQVEEHDVLEIITRDSFRFYDQNQNRYIDSLAAPNRWGFVPIVEIYNEWDSTLQGGQSDFESPLPFIKAFHDVLKQGLQAHKYHSTPKVVMKLNDLIPFLRNNFPGTVDEATGGINPNATISWRGNEIMFLQSEEDAKFLEAKSVLGDTKTLLEFLLDCICIASETPEWAFMRVDSGSANSDRNAQTVPFIKKIERKRINFTDPIQTLMKMAQIIRGDLIPIRPTLTWEVVRPDDQVVMMQAFQQLMMGLEVALQEGEISDETYRKMIRQFLPTMKNSAQEARDAERDQKKRDQRSQELLEGAGRPALPVGGPQGENE